MLNNLKLIGYAVAVIIAGLTIWKIYSVIYDHGYDAGTAVKQAEIDRTVAVNNEAISLAQKHADALTEQLRQKEIIFNNQLQELMHEADADPDASVCGIGSASVRRLNAIR